MNKRVKELRKVLNLSQKEFADKLQITQAGLSKIEVGGSILTERNIKTISEKFNVNEDWLRNGNEPIFNNDYSNMDISQRLKLLRKEKLKLSQEEFSNKLDISRANMSSIEIGRIALTERNIKAICQTFNVNENWLRNGNEPIFNAEEEKDLIKSLKNKYKLDEVSTSLLTTFVNLDDFSKKNIVEFLLKSIEDYYINNPDKLKELNKNILNIQQEKTKIVARGKGITYEDKSKIDKIIENSEDLNLEDIDFL